MTEHRINIMDDNEPAVAAGPQPQEKEPQVVYAAVSERFVAFLIDYGVVFIPCQLVGRLVFKMLGNEAELWHYFAWMLLVNGLFILYETIFSCGDRVSLGKSLMGLAVMQKDLDGPLSFVQALKRAAGYYLSGFLLMCGFLLAFFDDRHRALHDILGESVVVQVREKTFGERALVRALGSLLLITFAWTAYAQFFGKGALVDQYYIRHARKHLRKVAALEEVHKARYGYYTNDLLRLSLLSGDPVQFQRDTQKILAPKGFRIGVTKDSYKISAIAKDKKKTRVAYSPD